MTIIDERRPQVVNGSLPVVTDGLYFTDCTCATRHPARAKHDGRWIEVCAHCRSTRVGTNT